MKLIVCDMSGIVSIKGVNNSKLLDVFPKLKNFNYTFCTGKGYLGGYDTVKNYPLTLPFICENGTVIVSKSGKIEYSDVMNKENVLKLIDDLTENSFEFIAFVNLNTHKYKFLRGNKELTEDLSKPFFFSEETFFDKDEYKNEVMKYDISRIITRGLEIKKPLKSLDRFHMVVSENDFHSFCNNDSSKRSGIEKLIKIYNIDLKDVVIIGNDMNDIDMFKLDCGLKIATGNNATPKELLELSDIFVKLEDLPQFLIEVDKNVDNMIEYAKTKGENL